MATTASLSELRAAAADAEAERAALMMRLEPLRKGTGRSVGKQERDEVEGDWKIWKGRAERRKKAFEELWSAVGEALPEGSNVGKELWVSLRW